MQKEYIREYNTCFKFILFQQITNSEHLREKLIEIIPHTIFSISKFDDRYWNQSKYFKLDNSFVLIYPQSSIPLVIANCHYNKYFQKTEDNFELNQLPRDFLGHVTKDFKTLFKKDYSISINGSYYKMLLNKASFKTQENISDILLLSKAHKNELNIFYQNNYPKNWFDENMLSSNFFMGIKKENKIACVTGIHAYSKEFKIAIIASIATDIKFRRQGLATKVISNQCKELFKTVDAIGLNVNIKNKEAIKCYENLGFKIIGEYEEVKAKQKNYV